MILNQNKSNCSLVFIDLALTSVVVVECADDVSIEIHWGLDLL